MTLPSTDPAVVAAGLSEAQRLRLIDVCGCPGLFAGQYAGDPVPSSLVTNKYEGVGGFMGLSKCSPTELGLAVKSHLEGHPEP